MKEEKLRQHQWFHHSQFQNLVKKKKEGLKKNHCKCFKVKSFGIKNLWHF